ncbi:MAG: T9SS type A sorting domain-containing protein [Candidatus Stahlbacteria bacterium]|nr:T9SS type A sorting domain-containing protein [Candidatus Stahlbacteria bacterium]
MFFAKGGIIKKYSVIVLLSLVLLCLSALFSQPDTIVRVGACKTPGCAWNIIVVDTIAYIADYGAITVINVSAPSNPVMISSTPWRDFDAIGITIQDTIAYTNEMRDYSCTVSIANPHSLYKIGGCRLSHPGQFWYPSDICIKDTIIYLAVSQAGLSMVNIANPSSPETLGTYDTPGSALDVIVRDSFLFVADFDSLLILNVSNPISPYQLGAVDLPTSCWWGINISGNYVFITGQSNWGGCSGRLSAVDISNPTSPYIVNTIENIRGDPLDIQILGNYAYITACDYYEKIDKNQPWRISCKTDTPLVQGGLRIVNISNPDSLSLVASYDTPFDARGLFVIDKAGDRLIFVADCDSLQILKHIGIGIEGNAKFKVQNAKLEMYPNPFISLTTISYQIPEIRSQRSEVRIQIYDVAGRIVKEFNPLTTKPFNQVVWRPEKLPRGIYFAKLNTGTYKLTQKLILLH